MVVINLSSPVVDGSRVSVNVDPGEARRHLATGTLWADYGDLDLAGVDPSILILPALGSVLPVAFALGVRVSMPVVDAAFAVAVDEMVPVWRRMYPSFARDGFALDAERTTASKAPHDPEGAVLLYSGGLDSAASLIANAERTRALLSVWGADVSLDDEELWRSLDTLVDKTALTAEYRKLVVRSNLRELLDQPRLIHDFLGGPPADWWGGVQHGLGLLTLTAPVTASMGLGVALMAGSHSVDFNVPWGSSPATDNLTRWSGTHVEHDSYELTRQGKIDTLLAPYLRSGGDLLLAVCYQPGRGGSSINCGHCEKCLRTASGLLAAGIDPGSVGVETSVVGLTSWQTRLTSGERRLDSNEVFMWEDVQRSMDTTTTAPQHLLGYIEWLGSFDFSAATRGPATRGERAKAAVEYRARRFARSLPPGVQSALRRRL
jgi:hypothetical protein